MTKTMKIEGMMCPHCQARAEKALNALDGVTASVNLAEGTAVCQCDDSVTAEALTQAVVNAGYKVISVD